MATYWNADGNLDTLNEVELIEFARATANIALGSYARTKATAMRKRAAGHIKQALYYETVCERIYATLPPSDRW